MSGRLTAKEAGDLRAVIPGLGVAGRDGALHRVGARAKVQVRIRELEQEPGQESRRPPWERCQEYSNRRAGAVNVLVVTGGL